MVGFKIKDEGSLSSIYVCRQCLYLLRDPVQLLDCGHHICYSCFEEQHSDIIICPECHTKILRQNIKFDRGFKNEMQLLLVICASCNWTDLLKNYQNHLDEIHSNQICIHCEERFVSIHDLHRHQVRQCQKITIACPLKQFGCEEMILRANLKQHFQSLPHQLILMNFVCYLKSNQHSFLENNTIELQEILGTLDILSTSATVIHDDQQRLNNELVQYQDISKPLTQDFSRIKTFIQEHNSCVDSIQKDQHILEQNLNLINQTMIDIENTSYDGTFIWIINDIQSKINDAQSGNQTSIDSLPFYSSSAGYKMCLRIYLNGTGNGQGKYISLYFVLMRGEYDAILKFPFDFKIIFHLYGQTDKENHIIDSFQPDIYSNSFQRPRSDTNIASGISNFALLSLLQQENSPYIRDNTIFIKVSVDFNNISKDLLPNASNFNSRLATGTEDSMIRHDTKS